MTSLSAFQIVSGQNGPATVAEDGIHAFVGQNLHNNVGAAHERASQRMPGAACWIRLIVHVIAKFLRKYWIFRECLLISPALQYSTRGRCDIQTRRILVSIAFNYSGRNSQACDT